MSNRIQIKIPELSRQGFSRPLQGNVLEREETAGGGKDANLR
jgi:hypothetical protein